MRVRLSTDAEGIRTTYTLTGRWNDRPWSGFETGAVKALSVSAGVGSDGGYAVTVELLEGVMPAGALAADFAAALGAAAVAGA
jgi:hypothetical protein